MKENGGAYGFQQQSDEADSEAAADAPPHADVEAPAPPPAAAAGSRVAQAMATPGPAMVLPSDGAAADTAMEDVVDLGQRLRGEFSDAGKARGKADKYAKMSVRELKAELKNRRITVDQGALEKSEIVARLLADDGSPA